MSSLNPAIKASFEALHCSPMIPDALEPLTICATSGSTVAVRNWSCIWVINAYQKVPAIFTSIALSICWGAWGWRSDSGGFLAKCPWGCPWKVRTILRCTEVTQEAQWFARYFPYCCLCVLWGQCSAPAAFAKHSPVLSLCCFSCFSLVIFNWYIARYFRELRIKRKLSRMVGSLEKVW